MSEDPYVWPRESVADKPNQAWCTVCHHRFASTTGFDLHRGIRVRPRSEDAEDKGMCLPASLRRTVKLTAVDNVWYTPEDLALRARMIKAQAARQSKGTS